MAARSVSLSYDVTEPHQSILRIIRALLPNWGEGEDDAQIEIVRLTGGINNTLYKATKVELGSSKAEVDSHAILIRVYGDNTDVLVDREGEFSCHRLLQQYALAPPIFGRFENGYVYGFVPGVVCSPTDLSRDCVWRGVARKMAEWHALLPVDLFGSQSLDASPAGESARLQCRPDFWSVLQKWIMALPATTEADEARQTTLLGEAKNLISRLVNTRVRGLPNLVFAHCDLLGGNIIITPTASGEIPPDGVEEVHFVDFEYAMPTPAAFDIACHFSEWVGFDCDYNLLPTQAVRRAFLIEYIAAYNRNSQPNRDKIQDIDEFCKEVDSFRGLPGFFWGIAALLQAEISKIDFDFKGYADLRLAEYWAWRAEDDGSRAEAGKEIPIRERRWAEKV